MIERGGISSDAKLEALPSTVEAAPHPKPHTWRRKALRLLIIVAGTYLAVCIAVFFLQSHLIYFPSRIVEFTPKDVGIKFENLRLTARDGVSIAGWHVPCEASKGTVLFFHGNAGNLGDVLLDVQEWHRLNYAVVAIDYRGFGNSDGAPTEASVYEDAEAAWRYVVSQRHDSQRDDSERDNSKRNDSKPHVSEQNESMRNVSHSDHSQRHLSQQNDSQPDESQPRDAARRIIYHGRSLGGAVAIELAKRHPPDALIVESTFTSLPDVGHTHYPLLPVRWLARHRYDSAAKVGHLTCPKLFLHGQADTLIPIAIGEQLFHSAAEPKRFIRTDGDHTDGGMLYDSAVKQEVATWLEDALNH